MKRGLRERERVKKGRYGGQGKFWRIEICKGPRKGEVYWKKDEKEGSEKGRDIRKKDDKGG